MKTSLKFFLFPKKKNYKRDRVEIAYKSVPLLALSFEIIETWFNNYLWLFKIFECISWYGSQMFHILTLSPDESLVPAELHPRTVMLVLCRGSDSCSSWSCSFHTNSSPLSQPTARIFFVGCHAMAVAWHVRVSGIFSSFSPWVIITWI